MLAGLDVEIELEVVRREDRVIELHPREARDPAQAWFWTERWQRMEREADEDYAAGRYRLYDDAESFLADLEKPAEESGSLRRQPSLRTTNDSTGVSGNCSTAPSA